MFFFKSIGNDLDLSVTIKDQLDKVPGVLQLTLQGQESEGKIIDYKITLGFTNIYNPKRWGWTWSRRIRKRGRTETASRGGSKIA